MVLVVYAFSLVVIKLWVIWQLPINKSVMMPVIPVVGLVRMDLGLIVNNILRFYP